MMDWDNITRTGARAPGVERPRPLATEVLKRAAAPRHSTGIPTPPAESTKGGGQPIDAMGMRRRGRPCLTYRP